MDSPSILIKQVWDSSFCVLRGLGPIFLNFYVFKSIKIVFMVANNAYSDEMPLLPYAGFHLGLHYCQSTCLPVSRMKFFNMNL